MTCSGPGCAPSPGALPSFAATSPRCAWIFMEQNLGPHMEQNSALLKTSCGNVSSCIDRARSGSSDSANCLFQSKAERGRWAGDLVRADPLAHVVHVREAEVLLRRHVAEHGGPVLRRHGGADGARDVGVPGGAGGAGRG